MKTKRPVAAIWQTAVAQIEGLTHIERFPVGTANSPPNHNHHKPRQRVAARPARSMRKYLVTVKGELHMPRGGVMMLRRNLKMTQMLLPSF
jgi:hypothetical protein